MRKTKTELEIIKECIEFELVEVAGSNIENYTEYFTSEMDEEEEKEKFEKNVRTFIKKICNVFLAY